MSTPAVVDALATLRDRIGGVRLGLATPGAEVAVRARDEITGQIDDYLLPRLRQLEAPLLAVVGGSTGAGKSTLVNTLVGEDVTTAGWLRPTTRAPVLVCNPDDVPWFESDRILPTLSRTTGDAARATAQTLRIATHAAVPAGLALLDAPDVDSVVAQNRELAAQLIAAADLWIFGTTAARYADAVPWELLHAAQQRSTALAVVLNRVPPEGISDIGAHLAAMLDENGLGDATLFVVPEVPMDSEGALLPEFAIAPLRTWLTLLGGDAQARAAIVRSTLDGALRSMRTRVAAVAREVDTQLATAALLRDEAGERFAAATADVDAGIRGGSVLRGEVLARWQEFVGTGEFTRNLEARIGRLRDRVTAFVMGRPAPDVAVEQALESSLEALVRAAADKAAERTLDAWRMRPAGAALADARSRELAQSSDAFRPALEREIRGWQQGVLTLVAEEGGQKRTLARLASFGTNGAGLVLMLAVFAHTGGLTGGEVLIAGGTTAVSHKLLEAVFGDSAVRLLATRAREDLLARVEQLLDDERERFDALVDGAAPAAEAATELRAALDGFERARREFRSSGARAEAIP